MIPLWRKCVAEAIGTGFIVLFGTGSVACQMSFGAYEGLFQIGMIWGLGVSLAIFSTAAVSGAHLNPAVSLTLALLRRDDFPIRELAPYVVSQILGGVVGSACVLAVFHGTLERADEMAGVVRGSVDESSWQSVGTAAAFGEYFPNPGTGLERDYVTVPGAFAVEAFGTAILMFMIFALTDDRNAARPPAGLAPFFIGMTVTVLISLFAPLTQAGWNPARDFAPRIVAAAAGYGTVAIPGPRGGFWVYILGPCVGAPLGGVAYDVLIRPGLPEMSARPDKPEVARIHPSPPGMWCPTQAALQAIMREACLEACSSAKVIGAQAGSRLVADRPPSKEAWA